MPTPTQHLERAKQAFAAARYDLAAQEAEQATDRLRGNAILRYILGASLTNLSKPDRALPHLQEAALLAPNTPDILAALANTYRELDRVDDALETCELALAVQPGFDPAIVVKSAVLRSSGRTAEAIAFIEPFQQANPERPALANEFADACLAVGRLQDAIAALEPVAARARASDPRRRKPIAASVLFKLAALLDQTARYDEAFDAAREANRGRPARVRSADELKRRWSPDRLAALPQATHRGVTPILVVGMPRSGTTLAERIIAAHPQGAGVGETQGLPAVAHALSELARPPTPAWMNANARQYLDSLERPHPGATHVADKLPGNDANIALASKLLPDVRVVHCVRDPRDVCLSCFMQDFPQSLAFATDLTACARQHREHEAIMQHWRRSFTVPIFELQYERLVAEPEPAMRELLEFLNLPWDPQVLTFHERAGHVRTASWNQVTRPISTSSVARWKNYERHLGSMLDALGMTDPPSP